MKVKCGNCQAAIVNGIPTHETGCRDSFVFTKRNKSYSLYNVYSLDVWGNAKEGFDVNDRSLRGSIYIPFDASDREIVKALKEKEYLRKRIHAASIRIDGDDFTLYIDQRKDGMPLYQLERI